MLSRFFRRDERIEEGVRKTRASWFGRLAVLLGQTEISDKLWDELEELLIGADVGVETTSAILDRLRERFHRGEFRTGADATEGLREELMGALIVGGPERPLLEPGLTVVIVVGVNGTGKTTTVAKLASYWRSDGRRVILAAGDTFRAAGAEQLEVWAERLGLLCVSSQPGADPGAIVYDAIAAARAREHDLVLVDTAGRLHTRTNLMDELKKIRSIPARQSAPSRSLLVLDATTGQNAITQARSFGRDGELDGVVVTKLDGTAKGGMVFAIARQLGTPVRFVGTGERIDDISEFDSETFVGALLRTEEQTAE